MVILIAGSSRINVELIKVISLNYAVQFDNALKRESVGTKRKSNTSIAKYKGMAGNQISAVNLKFYTFRAAYIYPVELRIEHKIFGEI
ncbi:MAG: hypothetical protein ACK57X_15775 [Bacteroidota bacterium]